MSNNNDQRDRMGGYRDRMSQRDDTDNNYDYSSGDQESSQESLKEIGSVNESNIHIGTDLLSGRRAGMIPSLVILMIFIGVFVFVLPRLDAFNHVIKPDVLTSGSDIPNYIRQGMSGEEVLSLQKALYKLGVFTVDDITGIYDTKSSEAVNTILLENSMETSGNCSLRAYRMILDMSDGADVVSVSDGGGDKEEQEDKDKSTAEKENGSKDDENKNDGETQSSRTSTTAENSSSIKTSARTSSSRSDDDEEGEEQQEKQKIRITEESVRLYAKMRKSSTILFYVQEDDEYTLLETATDDDGNVWYKIEYKDICNGWIQGDKAEVVS